MSREEFLISLMKYLKTPYQWSGKLLNKDWGLDCSGLVYNILKDLNIGPYSIMNAQQYHDYYIENGAIVLSDLNVDLGDLCFYGTKDKVHHVAMVINCEQQLIIEAGKGDQTCVNEFISKQKGAYVMVSNLHRLPDLYQVIRPKNLPWH